MAPLLTIALALFNGAADLARAFVASPPAPPAVTFYFQNRHEEQSFALVDDSGAAQPDVVKALSHFVRCWRTEREKSIHPRLVEIVAALSRHYRDARIEVISGYRARPYGAPHSKHFLGRAMDVHVDGVNSRKAARWVWENFRGVGVGFYPNQDFLHIDVRDLDVRWVDQARHGESAHAHYFGRAAGEPLPSGAPRLAYDAPKQTHVPVTAYAFAELPWGK
jgi:uncharacterized protein YcbK (DUF882 family)